MNFESWEKTHPRPQLRREAFFVLHKGWTLNGKKINVPFAPEAPLSCFENGFLTHLEYKVSFRLPENFLSPDSVVRLHFGAVDQICEVFLNNSFVGSHQGGYLPFSFDINDFLRKDSENFLLVKVTDKLSHRYPYGKQHKKPHRMWYTQTSGIWQNVWLEKIPKENEIRAIKITPNKTGVELEVETSAPNFCVEIKNAGIFVKDAQSPLKIEIPNPKIWSPDSPYLYDFSVKTQSDCVYSYFALRTCQIRRVKNRSYFFLNDEPLFLHGVLDQGYFQDGLFLPKTPLGYEDDILKMKELGFNLIRKHIKVEPEAFYYFCDKNGMLVLQDMVNSGPYSLLLDTLIPNFTFKKRYDAFPLPKNFRRTFFESHSAETIKTLYNHPSIVGWTIFNEGWGQFDSDRIYENLKTLDPTRFFDSTSGWFAQKKSDVQSEHKYYSERIYKAKSADKMLFLSECGGFSRGVEGHKKSGHKIYGYGGCKTQKELTLRIEKLYNEMILLSIPYGLGGAVFTQLSDVEGEINGLYTYDRIVCKVEKSTMRSIAEKIKNQFKKEVENSK